MKSAQLLDSNNNILPIRDLSGESPKQDEEEEEGGNGEDSGAGERPKRLSLDIPLSGNRVAKVYAPADLTRSDAQKIGKVLQALSSSD
jgi:hypothetical protein